MSTARALESAATRTTGVLWLAAGLVGLLWLVSGISTVEPGSRAVVLRWGAVDRVITSGLVVAWPLPLETIVRIPGSERTQSTLIRHFASPASAFRIADVANPSGGAAPYDAPLIATASTPGCLTGDAGMVHLTGTVVWTVSEPRLFAALIGDGPTTIVLALERCFAAAAVAACARRSVDGVLVVGTEVVDDQAAQARDHLRGELLTDLNRRLEALNLGITAQRIDLVVELPDAAKPAFAEVLTAAQSAERAVATARASAERTRQEALQARAQRLTDATATAQELISGAHVATDVVISLAQEHDPRRQFLLRERIYHDFLDTVLHQAGQVTLVASGTPSVLWLMPLLQPTSAQPGNRP